MGADLARVFVACGAACVVGACTLTVSTSGLTGGGGATSEAGAGDAPVTDAPGVVDAASDADVVTEAGPVTFCKQKTHTLCADFDDASWTSKFRTLLRNGGSVADTTDHVSPPRSGLCSVPPSGVKEVSARIAADLPNVPSELVVAFDIKICDVTAGFIEILKLEMTNTFEADSDGLGDAAIAISGFNGEWYLRRFGYLPSGTPNRYDESSPLPKPDPDVWYHVELTTKLSTNAGSVSLKVDGTTVVEAKGIRTLTEGARFLRPILGVYTSTVTQSCVVKIDNFTVDAS
ncbi:MAG: hypothetical protein JST00_03520 [Deltaproteobacteria bacterium]|nr:hypothetical protein [Deltaproteobacteria bacterium]